MKKTHTTINKHILNLGIVALLTCFNLCRKDHLDSGAHQTAREGDFEEFKKQLGNLRDITKPNKKGETVLHCAVQGGDQKKVEEVLNKNRSNDFVNKPDNQGNTALHLAQNNLAIIKLLLNNNADINSQDSKGKTLLYWLVKNGRIQSLGTVVNHYSSRVNSKIPWKIPDSKAVSGRTLMHLAATKGNGSIIDMLAKLPDGQAQLDAKDSNGRTPFHLAAQAGKRNVVDKLIALKNASTAYINQKDSRDYTALHLAAGERQAEVVKLLLAKGADIRAKNNSEQTPLEVAALSSKMLTFQSKKNIMMLLLREGGNKIPRASFDKAMHTLQLNKETKTIDAIKKAGFTSHKFSN